MYNKCSDEELKWQRRSDAITLAEAEQIKADKARYRGAVLGAKELAQEAVENIQGIAKLANVKLPSISPKNELKENNTAQSFNKRGYKNPATIGRM